jgi:hypothetical protein
MADRERTSIQGDDTPDNSLVVEGRDGGPQKPETSLIPARPAGLTRDQSETRFDRVPQLYKCGVGAGSFGRESHTAVAPEIIGLNDPRPPHHRVLRLLSRVVFCYGR